MKAPPIFIATVLTSVLAVTGCSKSPPEKPIATSTSPSAAPSDRSLTAVPTAEPQKGQKRTVKVSNNDIDFEYTYPASADAIPELKAILDADLAKQKAALIANAQEQKADRSSGGAPDNPLSNEVEWKVVTDLPGWLSLSADVSEYEGGAHPNHGFDSLLWDKTAKVRRSPVDLFTSKAALSRAIREPFCAALNKQRAAKRGEPVDPKSTDEFDKCIDPVESTLILGSSNHRTFDRIGVLISPYEAGSYAEGDYQVTLPVTDSVIAATKPADRTLFSAGH